jgi:hypothetical protein
VIQTTAALLVYVLSFFASKQTAQHAKNQALQGAPGFKPLRGWQVTVFQLVQKLLALPKPRRQIIDITGAPNCGKGTFLEQLATPEAWPFMHAATESPGVLDLTQIRNTDDLCLFYRGQGICYADFPKGRKGSLNTRPNAAAVIETCTDYKRDVYSGKYNGTCVNIRSHVVILAGNEDLAEDLFHQKLVYKIDVPNDPHDEDAWQRADPNDVVIHFPGQAPQFIPPLGRVGQGWGWCAGIGQDLLSNV